MISCLRIHRQEIFSGNRFGTNKKILSSYVVAVLQLASFVGPSGLELTTAFNIWAPKAPRPTPIPPNAHPSFQDDSGPSIRKCIEENSANTF